MAVLFRALSVSATLSIAVGASAEVTCVAADGSGSAAVILCQEVGAVLLALGEVDAPVRVTPIQDGAGEGALSYAVRALTDDTDLIVATSGSELLTLLQGGSAVLDQIRLLSALGADPGMIAVAADSPFQSLGDLVAAIQAKPEAVAVAGGSGVGGLDHLQLSMLLDRAGGPDAATLRYVDAGSGPKAVSQTLGGFAQAVSGQMSDLESALVTGEMRALATLTETRLLGFNNIPTAREQGFDVVAVDWWGFYVPRGTDATRSETWSAKLRAVAESEAWQDALAAQGYAPFSARGDDLQSRVETSIAEMNALARALGRDP